MTRSRLRAKIGCMETLFAVTRSLAYRVIEFCIGTRLAPIRAPAADSHLHWDRVVRAWR
jgi:hypothetical protein